MLEHHARGRAATLNLIIAIVVVFCLGMLVRTAEPMRANEGSANAATLGSFHPYANPPACNQFGGCTICYEYQFAGIIVEVPTWERSGYHVLSLEGVTKIVPIADLTRWGKGGVFGLCSAIYEAD